nr:hypothetical protein CIP107545_00535 [Corynebacterium diphtheriae]
MGVVNSYIIVPAGAHRVVAIVTGVSINRHIDANDRRTLRIEGDSFKSGLTNYPPLHAPV